MLAAMATRDGWRRALPKRTLRLRYRSVSTGARRGRDDVVKVGE
jgi:hypothetical protein